MKLLRLALENWRGVKSREIDFADGVTLIEGPNEIGKSTLVEALHTLFEELDSSNKKTVKAIQPVGQDVGSQVEAEIITGDYHIVYTKNFNKNKQTELRIKAPITEQLTGREAHERAEQILQATIDVGLWNALLVEQGKEITGVHLADSDGLARALDEAAGSSSANQDDSDLFEKVQAEYEQYFTLKTGKSKFAGLEMELNEARVATNVACDALSAIETDITDLDRCVTEIRRLEDAIPELQENVNKHQTNWDAISSIQQKVESKQSELDSAQQLWQAAKDEQDRRNALIDDLSTSDQSLEEKSEQIAQLEERTKSLKFLSNEADRTLKDRKAELKQARETVELSKSDEQYLQALEELAEEKQRLTRLEDYSGKAESERTKLTEIQINTEGLEKLRRTESELQVAIGKRDAATSIVEIEVEQALEVFFNDEHLNLATGAVEKRNVSAELCVGIPGVAHIRVTPSQSAAELEADVEEYEATLTALLDKYAVKSLADAVATDARRIEAERDLKIWNDKIVELLGDVSEADIKATVKRLRSRCNTYAAERTSEPQIPADIGEANALTKLAEKTSRDCDEAVESQQEECERLRDEYRRADADHRVAKKEVDGLKLDMQRKQHQLNEVRAADPDEAVHTRVTEKFGIVETLQGDFNDLKAQLESASPDAAEALLTNAQASYQRAENDLQTQKRTHAVLEDRLTQAQANGRFEVLEAAERELEELEARHESSTTRAAAAERLWQTLNKHRDATRKAYVRPLKDGIEQLGRIVFGSDFSVDLDDDWTLVSCTRNATTIPFEALSVGMKEQLGILTRLAAARIVSTQDGVPLIIDDALGFSDPGRLETMGAAIAATGKDSQIILLTCTPGRFTHVGSAEVVRL